MYNLQFKKILPSTFFLLHSRRGFTLLETVVATAIIGVVGFIIIDLLSRTFQGTEKTQQISVVKQNGQAALSIMDQTVRNSSQIICLGKDFLDGTDAKTLTVYHSDGYIRFLVKPGTTDNGYIAQDFLDAVDANLMANSCDSDTDPIAFTIKKRLYITNQELVSGVKVVDGEFLVSHVAGASDVVSIDFTLGPGIGVSAQKSTRQEQFKTTVKLFKK